MLILIAILIALIPAVAILYPFLRGPRDGESFEDESSTQAELQRRWDAALGGLKNAELEWSIGTLAEEDYRWLRQQYMKEAALVMKAMELEEEQEEDLLSSIELELKQTRLQADSITPSRISPIVPAGGTKKTRDA